MKKIMGKCKLNNSGATLVAVLMAVAFIAILGSVSIVAAMVNLKMKVVDRQGQKTFYSCEEAVDEMYARLGEVSMKSLDDAYQELMDTMVHAFNEGTEDDPIYAVYKKSDDYVAGTVGLTQADIDLRKKYMANVVSSLGLGSFAPTDTSGELNANKLRTWLNSYIGVDDTTTDFWTNVANGSVHYPYVDSMGRCYYYRDYTDVSVYVLVAQDVRVRYIDDTGYQSDLVFDIGIKLPITDINWSTQNNAINKVPAMSNFSLIADTDIRLEGIDARTIDGNVYAGANGITAGENSNYTYVGEHMITSGDLILHRQSTTNISGASKLWCNNIMIPKSYTSSGVGKTTNYGVTLSLNGGAFVKNDLNDSAASSNITIAGHYFGYMNEGMSGDSETGVERDLSSAIIINGSHSNLTLKTSYLYLGGRSYIVYDSTSNEPYRTGESLSFKGDQEAYLVPPSALNDAAGASIGNPVSAGFTFDSTMATALTNYLTTDFFGKDLLTASKPYITKRVPSDISLHSDDVYYYLNFSNATNAATYMKMVLESEDAFKADCAAYGITGAALTKALTQKNYMLSLIEVNLKDLDQQTSGFIAPVGTVYSSGVMVSAEVVGSTSTMGNVVSLAPDTSMQIKEDLKNRYTMLTEILDMPNNYALGGSAFADWGSYSTGTFTGAISGNSITYPTSLNSNSGTTPATRIINSTAVDSLFTVAGVAGNTVTVGDGDYRIVIANGGYTYDSSSGFKGGIIVSKGGRIQLNADFDGLAICLNNGTNTGEIVVNNVNVSNTIDAADLLNSVCTKLNENGQTELSAAVLAVFGGELYVSGTSSSTLVNNKVSISSVTYGQLVYFDNWKKTDVTDTTNVLPAAVTP
jgi:hypothetical protein